MQNKTNMTDRKSLPPQSNCLYDVCPYLTYIGF